MITPSSGQPEPVETGQLDNGAPAEMPTEARQMLERVLSSTAFSSAPSLSRLLRHVVERTLEGRADELKEYALGVDVFDRGVDFDPRTDTIVRVQARRLRAKLEEYYAGDGRADRVVFDLPKGRYVPSIHARDVPLDVEGRPGRVRRWSHVAVLAGLAAVGGGWWLLSSSRAAGDAASVPAARTPWQLTRVTFEPGLQIDATWSPDGRHLAYASDSAGSFDIWTQPVEGGRPTQVTTSGAVDTQPSWSPDGALIAFRSDRDGGGLFVVPPAGGVARRLTTEGSRPMWLPGGREIMYEVGHPGPIAALYVVSRDGDSAPREILKEFLSGGVWKWVAPHPDGRISLAGRHREHGFALFDVGLDGTGLSVNPIPRRWMETFGLDVAHPKLRFHWGREGTALFLEVSPHEVPGVWRVRAGPSGLDWSSTESLTGGPGNAVSAAVSPDGRRLAFTSVARASRVWVFGLDEASGTVLDAGRPVTPDGVGVRGLVLSPDGRRLAFWTHEAGRQGTDLSLLDLESGESRVLARGSMGAVFSPDGGRIGYLLYRAPDAPGDTSPSSASTVEFTVAVRDLSSAERLLGPWGATTVFSPTDWSARDEMVGSYWEDGLAGPVVLALWALADGPSGGARRILHEPGLRFWQARFSPDDRWVSFVAQRDGAPGRLEMGVIPARHQQAGRWRLIASDHPWPDKPRWAGDGRTLYFLSSRTAEYVNLWGIRMDPATGTPRGAPFQVTHFDSPHLAIDPEMADSADMDIAAGRLALTMVGTSGHVWLLSAVDD